VIRRWSCVTRLALALDDREKVSATPEEMAFSLDELPWRLAGLVAQLRLLVPNPSEFGNRVGPRDIQARFARRDKRHATVRRMHR
jgi:hypothetical protein